MKSKMIMASLLAILMVVTVVPMTFSEDSDAFPCIALNFNQCDVERHHTGSVVMTSEERKG